MFVCKRCGYSSERKFNLKTHLLKKKEYFTGNEDEIVNEFIQFTKDPIIEERPDLDQKKSSAIQERMLKKAKINRELKKLECTMKR